MRVWRRAPSCIEAGFGGAADPCRPGADPRLIAGWEHRHGFRLPSGLRAWLMLSNGLYLHGPLDPPDLGDRADDRLLADPRPAGSARKLVRAGQPERRDDLHRPGLSLAGRRQSRLHLGRRADAEHPEDHRAELRGVVPRAPAPRRPGILVRSRISSTLATRGRPTAAIPRSPSSRTACGLMPSWSSP